MLIGTFTGDQDQVEPQKRDVITHSLNAADVSHTLKGLAGKEIQNLHPDVTSLTKPTFNCAI